MKRMTLLLLAIVLASNVFAQRKSETIATAVSKQYVINGYLSDDAEKDGSRYDSFALIGPNAAYSYIVDMITVFRTDNLQEMWDFFAACDRFMHENPTVEETATIMGVRMHRFRPSGMLSLLVYVQGDSHDYIWINEFFINTMTRKLQRWSEQNNMAFIDSDNVYHNIEDNMVSFAPQPYDSLRSFCFISNDERVASLVGQTLIPIPSPIYAELLTKPSVRSEEEVYHYESDVYCPSDYSWLSTTFTVLEYFKIKGYDYGFLKLLEKHSQDTIYCRFTDYTKLPFMVEGWKTKMEQLLIGHRLVNISEAEVYAVDMQREVQVSERMEFTVKGMRGVNGNQVYVCHNDIVGDCYIPIYAVMDGDPDSKVFSHMVRPVFVFYEFYEMGRTVYGEEEWQKMLAGEIALGFTEDMCKLVLGKPKDVKISVSTAGTIEQWIYDDQRISFKNGVVTAIEK